MAEGKLHVFVILYNVPSCEFDDCLTENYYFVKLWHELLICIQCLHHHAQFMNNTITYTFINKRCVGQEYTLIMITLFDLWHQRININIYLIQCKSRNVFTLWNAEGTTLWNGLVQVFNYNKALGFVGFYDITVGSHQIPVILPTCVWPRSESASILIQCVLTLFCQTRTK